MIRKEPRKLVNKTYKAVVFQPAIDFLQQLSVSAFVRHPDFKKVLCGCWKKLVKRQRPIKKYSNLESLNKVSLQWNQIFRVLFPRDFTVF